MYRARERYQAYPNVKIGVAHSIGRRKTMEDRHCVQTKFKNWILCAIFDGHGGNEVSDFLAEHLPAKIMELNKDVTDITKLQFKEAFQDIDEELFNTIKKTRALNGSTACVAVFDSLNNILVTANTGDSFCIAVAESGTLVYQTESHNVRGMPIADRERIAKSDYVQVTYRDRLYTCMSDSMPNLVRAFGNFGFKVPNNNEPVIRAMIVDPAVSIVQLQPGDTILLGCDGINETCTNEFLGRYLHTLLTDMAGDPIDLLADELVRWAYDSDSNDNLSCILIRNLAPNTNKPLGNKTAKTIAVYDGTNTLPERVCKEYGLPPNLDLTKISYPYTAGSVLIERNEKRPVRPLRYDLEVSAPMSDRVTLKKQSVQWGGVIQLASVDIPETLTFFTKTKHNTITMLFRLDPSKPSSHGAIYRLYDDLTKLAASNDGAGLNKLATHFREDAKSNSCQISVILREKAGDTRFVHFGKGSTRFYIFGVHGSSNEGLGHLDVIQGEPVKMNIDKHTILFLSTFDNPDMLSTWPSDDEQDIMGILETWLMNMAYAYPTTTENGTVVWCGDSNMKVNLELLHGEILFQGMKLELRCMHNASRNGLTAKVCTFEKTHMLGTGVDVSKPMERSSVVVCDFLYQTASLFNVTSSDTIEDDIRSLDCLEGFSDHDGVFERYQSKIKRNSLFSGSICRCTSTHISLGVVRKEEAHQVRCVIRGERIQFYEQYSIQIAAQKGDVVVMLTLQKAKAVIKDVCSDLSLSERQSSTILFQALFGTIRTLFPTDSFGLVVLEFRK